MSGSGGWGSSPHLCPAQALSSRGTDTLPHGWGVTVSFTESTGSNANLFQKHPHGERQKHS